MLSSHLLLRIDGFRQNRRRLRAVASAARRIPRALHRPRTDDAALLPDTAGRDLEVVRTRECVARRHVQRSST